MSIKNRIDLGVATLLVVGILLASCSSSSETVIPTLTHTPPIPTPTRIYTSTPRPLTPTKTPIQTVIPGAISTPVSSFELVEHCGFHLEIPMDFISELNKNGDLLIVDPMYKQYPSFSGRVKCRERTSYDNFGNNFKDEMGIQLLTVPDIEKDGIEVIHAPTLDEMENPFKTESGASFFYFTYSMKPSVFGATIVDRVWVFTVVDVSQTYPNKVIEVTFATDINTDKDLLIHIVKSIAP